MKLSILYFCIVSNVIVITEKMDFLPFYEVLTWERFQLFCTDVLYKRNNAVDSREYLSQGSGQHGIDVYVISKGTKKRTVAQCKLEKYVGPQDIIDIVDLFLAGKFVSETAEFILCTNHALTTDKAEEAIAVVRSKLKSFDIELRVWDKKGLSMELRTNPSDEYVEIVYHFFNEDICRHFFGERWESHIRKLRLIDKPAYISSVDHIERSVTSFEERLTKPGKTNQQLLSLENSRTTLADVINKRTVKKPVRVTLLSIAGFGKSEELQHVAAHYSVTEEKLYPIKYSLGNYEGQDIQTILDQWNENWRNISDENLLLVFDSIDEIGKPADLTFYHKMNTFLELHPDINAVVSSRYNFYDVIHQPLKGFSILLLDPLNYYDIDAYLRRQLPGEKQTFQDLVYNKGFSDYQQNPYYLTRMVRFFKDRNTVFPANKTELFQRILFEQLGKDQSTYHIPGLQKKLYEVSGRIAFCMTLSGKASLTEDELELIVPDQGTRDLLRNFAILNRDSSESSIWSFEHKNMQEYLCATALKNVSFTEVHKIISLQGIPNKLLPKFLNTVSFLFELLDKNDPLFTALFHWINTNEPELLVRFEKEQIDKATRNQIFFGVFASYKAKGLSLRSSTNFSFHELASFVGVDETIVDFLAAEIKPTLQPGLLFDAVNIISLCQRPYTIKDKICNILFGILVSPDYSLELKASCIRSFYSLQFTDRETFDRVMAFSSSNSNSDIRGATLSLLEYTNFQEDFSDYIIDNFHQEAIASDDRQPREAIKRMVLKFTAAEKIKDLIRFCVNHPKVFSKYHPYRSLQFTFDETKDILDKAAAIYHINPSILPLMYCLYCKIEHLSIHDEWNKLFVSFFERTCGKERIFMKFYWHGRRPHDMLGFAEEKTCDFIIEEIKRGNVSTKEGLVIRNVLSHINYPLYLYFYEQLKKLPESEEFTADEDDTDYAALRVQQATRNQEMLLDKTLFLKESHDVFEAVEKEKITNRDLWFSETRALRRLQDSIALKSIRDFSRGTDDQEISISDYFAKFEDEQEWIVFVVNSVKNLIEEDNTMASIRPELIRILTEWTIKEVERIDFDKHTIVEYEEGGYGYFEHTEFVKQCVELLKPELSDDLLAKLLKADYGSFYSLGDTGNEEKKRQPLAALIMEQFKDKDRLQREVITNIRNSTTPFRVRSTHFKICHLLGLNECLPKLFEAITGKRVPDSFDRIKLSEIYVDMGGKWMDFSGLLSVPESPSYEKSFVDFHWHLLEKLMYEEPAKVSGILNEVLRDDKVESNRLKAAELLIRLSGIEGLRYWLDHVRSKKDMLFESRWETFYDYIKKMPFKETVDIFIQGLDSIFQAPAADPASRFWRLDDTIFNSLVNLAIQGKTELEYIEQLVAKLLKRTIDEGYRYTIRYFQEKMRSNYYQSLSQDMTIEAANRIFNQYLVTQPVNSVPT